MICLTVSIEYRRVTDRRSQTADGHLATAQYSLRSSDGTPRRNIAIPFDVEKNQNDVATRWLKKTDRQTDTCDRIVRAMHSIAQ